MFGALRALLAILVAMSHLIDEPFFGQYGRYAVFGFYVISGYLITRILNEVYNFDQKRFWINRILRLYPIYFFVLAASWILVNSFPEQARDFSTAWGMGATFGDILANIFIFPLALSVESIRESTRIVLPAWSVAVELQCYLVLAIFTSRSKSYAFVTLALAASWHFTVLIMKVLGHTKFTFGYIYYPFYAALLPFAIGSLLYFYRSLLISKLIQLRIRLDVILGIWLVNLIFSQYVVEIFKGAIFITFYANLIIVSILITLLMSRRSNAIDKWLGDLAYPIFLTHYVVHFVIMLTLFGRPVSGFLYFCISLPFTLLVSIALAKLANQIVEPLRSSIRNKST